MMNLKQLAKALNLSISTVSKALRDSHEISVATKKAVVDKVKELNYQVNPFASSLRNHKSKTIAVVIPDVANNFFALAINGIESIAQEKGYHVLIYLTHENLQKEISITKLLQNGRVDGVMMSLASNTTDSNHLLELTEKEIPLVLFDRVAENLNLPKVTTDDYDSGFTGTEHLIENGCKRIAFLSIFHNLSIINKRMNGYKDALEKNGMPFDNSMIIQCNNDNEYNHSLIRTSLAHKKRPDGLFASIEKLAISSYAICNEMQLKIPDDVKIISFSNLPMASLLNPSMTTITQPAFEIGREAASILFNLIAKKDMKFIREKTVLKSILIPRNSTMKKKEIK